MAAENPDQYISELPVERQEAMNKLRKLISANLPKGFIETMSYGMIGYVVPRILFILQAIIAIQNYPYPL